jgi:[FeFe] hydrogenase H-cluster maturation GTPase HydF
MELLPLGPVVFIDTAGIDDVGAVGELRTARTRRVLDRTDLGVIVTDGVWGAFEESLRECLTDRGTPVIAVFNKRDLVAPPPDLPARLTAHGVPLVETVASCGRGILDFRQALLDHAPPELLATPTILADLVGPGGTAVLVVPIDKEAPKGRIILPQVQAIRDLLDAGCLAVVVKEQQLRAALANLRRPPQLVVTDSQAFRQVATDTPPGIPLTSFSILFARLKGDLMLQTEGALAIESLRPGDRVLIAEACTHHPIEDDIGRVKIPRWLSERVGGELRFDTVQGHDFPEELSPYRLVIHCGACMLNRREVLTRLLRCQRAGVPVTNYGLAIAASLGVLERALEPFPAALAVYRRGRAA